MSQSHRAKIRRKIREARNQIPDRYARQASYKFSESFAGLEAYQSAQLVAGFLPFDGEADPLPLMDRAIQSGKQVFVPHIVGKQQPLLFAPWNRDVPLRKNQFGINEPDVAPDRLITAEKLEFVITPLVAFDDALFRIGVGGGFYDRTFQFVKSESRPHPVLVGIAYELQRVESITPESWDVQLDGVVTELTTRSRS